MLRRFASSRFEGEPIRACEAYSFGADGSRLLTTLLTPRTFLREHLRLGALLRGFNGAAQKDDRVTPHHLAVIFSSELADAQMTYRSIQAMLTADEQKR